MHIYNFYHRKNIVHLISIVFFKTWLIFKSGILKRDLSARITFEPKIARALNTILYLQTLVQKRRYQHFTLNILLEMQV